MTEPVATASRRATRRSVSRVRMIGQWSAVVALVGLATMTFLPTSYVIQQPGPVYNTIGSVTTATDGEVPLIEVHDDAADADESTGTLDLTTVQVVGNREQRPTWLELATAWLDPSRAVVPIDLIFPENQTSEERDAINTQLMTDSQAEAKAAALIELGYDVPNVLRIAGLSSEDSPAAGKLQEGDIIVSVDGLEVGSVDDVRAIAAGSSGQPVPFVVERDGSETTAEVGAVEVSIEGTDTWVFGVNVGMDFAFPVDVTIQLDDVGGPSAGTMFALGIIDKLTPGDLTGGKQIAGTGTITFEGQVGSIGGIRQKLYGARNDGATVFLAPVDNCNEVVGHVPDGLDVYAVATLDEAREVVESVAADDPAGLRSCEQALQTQASTAAGGLLHSNAT